MSLIGFSEATEIYISEVWTYMFWKRAEDRSSELFWGLHGSVLHEVNGLMLMTLVMSHSTLRFRQHG